MRKIQERNCLREIKAVGHIYKHVERSLLRLFRMKKMFTPVSQMLPLIQNCASSLVEVLLEKAEKDEPFDTKE